MCGSIVAYGFGKSNVWDYYRTVAVSLLVFIRSIVVIGVSEEEHWQLSALLRVSPPIH